MRYTVATMILQKRHSIPLLLLVGSGAVVLLVVGITTMVVSVFPSKNVVSEQSEVPLFSSPEIVLTEYRASIGGLRQSLEAGQSVASVEETMLQVRVPAELLDDHLTALLTIKKTMRDTTDTETQRTSIQQALDTLIQQAAAV